MFLLLPALLFKILAFVKLKLLNEYTLKKIKFYNIL